MSKKQIKIPSEKNKLILNRLNRAEGQIKALKRMLEEGSGENCKDFITQIKAARSALKGVSEQYILTHIQACKRLPAEKRDKSISDAIKLLASDT